MKGSFENQVLQLLTDIRLRFYSGKEVN